MNIGIVTTWFERGAAYVSKAFADTLGKEHNIYIYARGGEYYANNDPYWNLPNVTWGRRTKYKNYIDFQDFFEWINKFKIQVILFNEQHTWDIILKLSLNNKIIIGTYIDFYTKKTIPFFGLYDFIISNTERHFSIFNSFDQSYFIPWGTNTETFKPSKDFFIKYDKVVFFHSAGMLGIDFRKGTDILVKAFSKIQGNAELIIHSQVNLDDFPEIYHTIKDNPKIKIIVGNVPAPGLYHLGNVYVYPSKLEGIGLTILEAMACGLPVITTNEQPMNEFVEDNYSGSLVRVQDKKYRKDKYYWPETIPSEDHLVEVMQFYIDNPEKISEYQKNALTSIKKSRIWEKNSDVIFNIFRKLKKKPKDLKLIAKVFLYINIKKISLFFYNQFQR